MTLTAPAAVDPAATATRDAALQALGLPYPDPAPAFEDLARLAAALCETPIALIALVDSRHTHVLASLGLASPTFEALETALRPVLQLTAGCLLLEDCDIPAGPKHVASRHPVNLRMLAAAPVLALDAELAIGYVCVVGRRPCGLAPPQQEGLQRVASQVRTLLALRRRIRETEDQLEAATAREAAVHLNLRALEFRAEQLATEAHTDPLTGIANRRRFDQELGRRLSERRPLSLGIVDLDAFKTCNDSRGHSAGDQLLIRIALSMQAVVSGSTLLARIGGDEFGLLHDGPIAECRSDLQQLLDAVRMTGSADGVTASIGIAVAQPAESSQSLYARADDALYASKRRGGNRLEVASHAGPVIDNGCAMPPI